MEEVLRRIATSKSTQAKVDDSIHSVDGDASINDIALPSLGDDAEEEQTKGDLEENAGQGVDPSIDYQFLWQC